MLYIVKWPFWERGARMPMVDLFLNRLPNSNTNRPMLVPNAIKLEKKKNICESKRKKRRRKDKQKG
jgi:hypothetical protein